MQVNVEVFHKLLEGKADELHIPKSVQLHSTYKSDIFIYMTGHGGDEFLKFRDKEELEANELALIFDKMHENKRYNRILFMVDTVSLAVFVYILVSG